MLIYILDKKIEYHKLNHSYSGASFLIPNEYLQDVKSVINESIDNGHPVIEFIYQSYNKKFEKEIIYGLETKEYFIYEYVARFENFFEIKLQGTPIAKDKREFNIDIILDNIY